MGRVFGRIRKLPSGRFQASYTDGRGGRVNAPLTFVRRSEARQWLSGVEADKTRGVLGQLDETLRRKTFGEYAREWLRDNPKAGPRYSETCLRNLRLHLAPLERVELRDLTTVMIRRWHAAALRGNGGRTSIAQSYRFLHAVLNGAVRENAFLKNPADIPGASSTRARERSVATPAQVLQLIEAITPRYRAAVLLAAWCGMRRGEVVGLRIEDVDLENARVLVRRNRVELLESPVAYDKDPKSEAGRRVVSIPPHVVPVLEEHMRTYAGAERAFVGRNGKPMRGDTVRQAFARARDRVGMTGFTFHDLRHTGSTLAASTGATLKDLMKRLGHATHHAALRYLHAVDGRDAEIASALSELAEHGDMAKLPRSITMG